MPRKKSQNNRKFVRKKETSVSQKQDNSKPVPELKEDGTNDPSWYATSENLLRDAASLSFSDVLGLPLDLSPNVDQSTTVTVSNSAKYVPGIMRINFRPSVGVSDTPNSAMNITARNLYSVTRYANSGKTNFESVDEMQYVIAASQAYAYIAHLIRIYGLINLYDGRNRYSPKGILQAMHVDFDDVKDNIADFRYYLRHFIHELSSLWIPNTMPLLVRWFWMNSNIYSDSDDPKSQIYFYFQEGYWKFNGIQAETGGGLDYIPLVASDAHLMTYKELINFGQDLLFPLNTSECIGTIAGDIKKAFGVERLFKLDEITDNYQIVPHHNPEALMQLSNLVTLPIAMDRDNSWNIKQSSGFFEFAPYAGVGSALGGISTIRKILDLNDQANNPSNVMVATRLMPVTAVIEDGENSEVFLRSCGSEVVTSCRIYKMEPEGTMSSREFTSYIHSTSPGNVALLADLSKFKYAPTLYVFNPTTGSLENSFRQLENYTTVGAYELTKMHETAVMSEFGYPYKIG